VNAAGGQKDGESSQLDSRCCQAGCSHLVVTGTAREIAQHNRSNDFADIFYVNRAATLTAVMMADDILCLEIGAILAAVRMADDMIYLESYLLLTESRHDDSSYDCS
jgi:hypothetical protein